MSAGVLERVLVAGAGITGAVTASILRQHLPETCHLSVWDKARGTGGRMGTTRSPEDPTCTVDLGAQFIAAKPDNYARHERYYTALLEKQVVSPLEGLIIGDKERPQGTRMFVCPQGFGALPKHYLEEAGASVQLGHRITRLDARDGRWEVTTDGGESEGFDAVVLTMPVPQILGLAGSIRDTIASVPAVKTRLQSVEYNMRYVLGLYYAAHTDLGLPWCIHYYKDDPVISFVAQDNVKRGSLWAPPSLSVLSSEAFSARHPGEDTDAVCTDHILPRLSHLLPDLPPHAGYRGHRWQYCGVTHGYPGAPGALVLHTDPLLVLAGDAFTGSRFDKCLDSAAKAASVVTGLWH